MSDQPRPTSGVPQPRPYRADEPAGGQQDPAGTPAPPAEPAPPAPAGSTGPEGVEDADRRRVRETTAALFRRLAQSPPHSTEHREARTRLIELNLPLVRYAAARFRNRAEPMEDIVQVGTIGLINAIDRFDPERGVQFPTFAVPTIIGEIKRYFRDSVWSMHVPRRLQEMWLQVSAATEELTGALGRSPTIAEIAVRLGIPREHVVECLEAGRAHTTVSLDSTVGGDEEGGRTLADRLSYEDAELGEVEHRDQVRHLLVQLPERERRIMMLRFFHNMTQSQISNELGISQMHVSRLLSRSLNRLRRVTLAELER
ncbi:RNA polymerase sigma factor SigF [Allostreptomyces psammosilenae]|uniref:RNA polymerase sigma-B factor n=1 Tax=Allostreptomyces psammosilenae TaxID=1892865 RepID=A0A852ZW84_9ACTN|nr:RNA polymerase sigma factor SigF [Allostreptomyces psammosilenae]NYI05510.1 RNA polymerase sigma-B factor [Allostreptomyces psammosilenae]